jgi:hypothetical protein
MNIYRVNYFHRTLIKYIIPSSDTLQRHNISELIFSEVAERVMQTRLSTSSFPYYFFFRGSYSPIWTLPLLRLLYIGQGPLSYVCNFLKPIICKFSSTESSHLTADLPTGQVPSGLCRVNFLQRFCFCILRSCPNSLHRHNLITYAISD